MTVEPDPTKVRLVSADEVAQHISPATAIEAARVAASAQCQPDTAVGRLTLPFPGGWMRVLGASVPDLGIFGYKEFHLNDGRVRYAIHLFSIADGRPLGIVDGALTTPLRTAGAAAAAAVAYYHDPRPLHVGVIGSGTEARAGLRALATALPIASAAVTSRSDENRRHFATDMSTELDLDVSTAPDVSAVSKARDIVYIATNSGGRVVAGLDALGDVPLVLSIGSTLPEQRELDAKVVAGAACLVIDTFDVLRESGDVLAAGDVLDRNRVVALADYLDAPRRPEGPTLYKSIGSPEQDVVLAARILEAAATSGFGREIEPLTDVKRNK